MTLPSEAEASAPIGWPSVDEAFGEFAGRALELLGDAEHRAHRSGDYISPALTDIVRRQLRLEQRRKAEPEGAVVRWVCPNAIGAPRGSRHECVAERSELGGWVIKCSCGYRALASSGEVIEAERACQRAPARGNVTSEARG